VTGSIESLNRPTDDALSLGLATADSTKIIRQALESTSSHPLLDTVEWLEIEIGAAETQLAETGDCATGQLEALTDRASGIAAEAQNAAGAATRAHNDAASAAAVIETLIVQIGDVLKVATRPVGGSAALACDAEHMLQLLGEIGDANVRLRRSVAAMGEVAEATSEISQSVGGIVASAFYASAAIGKARNRIADLRRDLLVSLRKSPAGNRRRERRVAVAIDAVLRLGKRAFCGRIEDLSAGGALFRSTSAESHGEIAPKALGELGVEGIGNIDATIVSISSAGVHLRFNRIDVQIEDRLRHWLGS
jgi:hypothetical protein